jgi:YfiH family protein
VSSGVTSGFIVENKGEKPSLVRQVHGDRLVEVEDAAHVLRLQSDPPEADAVFTNARGITLSVVTADCVPVLLYGDRPDSRLAAVHCGWRGARLGIVAGTVRRLTEPPSALRAVIGPCILGCCFEVRADFIQAFRELGRPIEPYLETREGKHYCHLDRYVQQVELKGLEPTRIDTSAMRCTYCSLPELPSYRRTGGTQSRLRAWIRRD